MNILVLEDSPERIKVFSEKLKSHTVTIVHSVKDAKRVFKFKKWDMLFLDHDLGGQQMADIHDSNTGSAFAKFLHDYYFSEIENTTIIIHSLNPIGAEHMKHFFLNAFWIPFPQLWDSLDIE